VTAAKAREIVAAEGLTKSFGATRVLSGVTFAVEGPGVLGILGPNGAGKTTLLELLEGLTTPTAGAVRLFGAPLDRRRYPRRRVGVVMQREFVLDQITAAEYAELFAAIYGIPGGRERILERAGLSSRGRTPVERLSGGEAQKLFIAAAAAHDPELLFLDEPTAQLDPASKREIGARIRELAASAAVLLTTHDLREADAVCDEVIFLVGGEVRARGTRQALIAAVPEAERGGLGLEDAFFHFCARRITAAGELE
jgi:ABC-2 type transport system ATP-binding protein